MKDHEKATKKLATFKIAIKTNRMSSFEVKFTARIVVIVIIVKFTTSHVVSPVPTISLQI